MFFAGIGDIRHITHNKVVGNVCRIDGHLNDRDGRSGLTTIIAVSDCCSPTEHTGCGGVRRNLVFTVGTVFVYRFVRRIIDAKHRCAGQGHTGDSGIDVRVGVGQFQHFGVNARAFFDRAEINVGGGQHNGGSIRSGNRVLRAFGGEFHIFFGFVADENSLTRLIRFVIVICPIFAINADLHIGSQTR